VPEQTLHQTLTAFSGLDCSGMVIEPIDGDTRKSHPLADEQNPECRRRCTATNREGDADQRGKGLNNLLHHSP